MPSRQPAGCRRYVGCFACLVCVTLCRSSFSCWQRACGSPAWSRIAAARARRPAEWKQRWPGVSGRCQCHRTPNSARIHSPVRPSCYRNRRGTLPITVLRVTATTAAVTPRLDGICIRRRPTCGWRDTQKLSDGELYYIIHNGVRWTGMPAWGEAANDNDQDSWKLVLFIRHLPNLSAEEIREMERFNPRSDAEREEEKEEQEFLNGGPAGDAAQKPQ